MLESKRILIFGGTSLYRRDLYRTLSDMMNLKIRVCEEYKHLCIKEYDFTEENFVEGYCKKQKVLGAFHWYSSFFRGLSSYDIVVVGGPTTINSWLLFLLKPFLNLKIVSWSHGIYGRESRFRLWIKSTFYRFCDLNLVYNNYALNKLNLAGIDLKRIYVVGNCTNRSSDSPFILKSEEKDFFENNRVVLFVGRITQEKRVDLLIEAFCNLSTKNSDLKLALVGPLVDNNILDIQSLDRNIHFLGPIYDNSKLAYYYDKSLFCVSPGNIGLTAISAILAGCPVITHNDYTRQGPEFECIEDGENGYFFDYNNVISLTETLVKAIEKDFDRKLIKANAKKLWSVEAESQKIQAAINLL